MALVNPNIAMSYRAPEIQQPNMLADYAAIQQIQGGRQAQELNALKMQEAQAALTERNALRQLNPAAADYENQLFRVNPTLGIQFRKEQSTAKAQQAAQAKSEFDLKAAQRKFGDDLKRSLSSNPSDANIIAFGEDAVIQGLYSPDQVKSTVSQLLALPPADRVRILSQAGASASELKPTIQNVNRSGQTDVLSVPAFGGTPVVAGTYADVPLPKAVEDQKARIALAGRAPRPEAAPRTQQVTLSDGSLGIVNMDTGVITPSTVGGAAVKGKLSAFAEKTAAQKTQMGKDINLTIKELTDATKDGGLIDQSTGSGAGALADIAAGFVGKATPGAIAIGKLAPIADLALKMVPRFEGPQSDKDTMSYKQAAGQLANASLPNAIRKEAGKTVLRLMQERKNQFGSADMAPSGVAPPAGFTPD